MAFDFEKYINEQESKKAGNQIGSMIASGIGVGLDENSYHAVTALENVYVELDTLTKNATKNAENLKKKQQQRELRNLKNALQLELITEQEYYTRLKAYRDENLRQGSDAWYSCTEEIIKYNKRLLDDAKKAEEEYQKLSEKMAAEAEKLAAKVEKSREKLQQSLTSDEPWFNSQKVRFLGTAPNGGDEVYNRRSLEDFGQEIASLERYRDAIMALAALGNIPQGVFEDIGKMDVQEAINAAETILSADEASRNRFIEGYNHREDLTRELSETFNKVFNKEELQKAGVDCADAFNQGFFGDGSEKSAFVTQLEKTFEQVPEEYYSLGEKSGKAFGEAVLKHISDFFHAAREQITAQINSLVWEFIQPAVQTDTSGTSNVYNTTYTFNASKDTTTMQLETAKNAATLERMRGGSDQW